jgi:hypothetical protein
VTGRINVTLNLNDILAVAIACERSDFCGEHTREE